MKRPSRIYLREKDPEAVPGALTAYRCFEPYGEDPQSYALATRLVPEGCERRSSPTLMI
jgi:erythromycin esterase